MEGIKPTVSVSLYVYQMTWILYCGGEVSNKIWFILESISIGDIFVCVLIASDKCLTDVAFPFV